MAVIRPRGVARMADASAVRQILAHLGEATSPPPLAPARGPPLWEMPLWEMPDVGQRGFDPQAQPAPDYEFDQRIAW
jgi:hypothetical protein